jgi:hypothetical protein
MRRTATCACGQLQIVCTGEPMKVSACHCLECQRRTGSPFNRDRRVIMCVSAPFRQRVHCHPAFLRHVRLDRLLVSGPKTVGGGGGRGLLRRPIVSRSQPGSLYGAPLPMDFDSGLTSIQIPAPQDGDITGCRLMPASTFPDRPAAPSWRNRHSPSAGPG